MSNKEQTAVEWLIEMTSKLGYVSSDIAEQAKEMEKEEKEISYADGYSQGYERVARLIEEATKLNILGDNNGEITTMGGDNNNPDTNTSTTGNILNTWRSHGVNITGNISAKIWGGDRTSTTENISGTWGGHTMVTTIGNTSAIWGGDTSSNTLYDSNTWLFRRKMVDENVNRIKTAKQIWDKETMAEYINKIEAEKQIWDKTVNWDIMNKYTRVNDEEQAPYNVKTNVVTSGKTDDGTLAVIEITVKVKQP